MSWKGACGKAGSRVRVSAQLVEATTGGHLWAERGDRDLADIFAVQDEIVATVSAAVQPTLERSERERTARKPPQSLDTWECYHRGMWHYASVDPGEMDKAFSFFRRAIELDPLFAPAHAALAGAYLREASYFRPELRAENIPRALSYAQRAVALDPMDATGHAALADALLMSGRHSQSMPEADLAVSLDPNSSYAYGMQGAVRTWGGRPREAIESLGVAMRLSPFDPRIPALLHTKARAHYLAGDYEVAIATARQLRNSAPNYPQAYTTLIAAFGQTGQIDEARAVMAEALERFGGGFHFFLSLPSDKVLELRPEDREHLIDGFRKAGLAA
jgi:adenylate cyclase